MEDVGRMTGMSMRMDAKDWVKVKKHLTNVYSLLGGASLLAAVGAYVEITYAVHAAWMRTVVMVMSLAMVFGVNGMFGVQYRKYCFMGLAFTMGFGFGPLLDYAFMLNGNVALYAFAGTFGIFSALTLSALMAKDQKYLMLGGLLSSALSVLFWMSIISLMFPSNFNYNLQLYGGLFVFCGYILFDTQRMIESAKDGREDAIKDATRLFVNLIGILRRILIILAKKEQSKQKRSSRRN